MKTETVIEIGDKQYLFGMYVFSDLRGVRIYFNERKKRKRKWKELDIPWDDKQKLRNPHSISYNEEKLYEYMKGIIPDLDMYYNTLLEEIADNYRKEIVKLKK